MILHRFEDNSKYGYRDENEGIVISAKYEDAKEFNENLAIVRNNGSFGVINSSEDVVIDFDYSEIEEHKLFFECKSIQKRDSIRIIWYNRDGVLLHEGLANALSEDFLCISNGKKYGVINQNGKRIINCLYDEIIQKNELFIVLRDDKLGLYDLNGNVILDTFCNSIESVIIENDWKTLGNTSERYKYIIGAYYPGFCKTFYFDSEDYPETFLKRERIYVKKDFWGKRGIEFYDKPIKDINKPIIISTDKEKILFLKSEGVILDDGFEEIQQLTNVTYAVKKKNLWGIYRLDTKSFIIPIENSNIRFYGGHTVLLCKDGLWGAKDILLDEPSYDIYKVSIPTANLEIAILDDYQCYFGCKIKDEYDGKQYYTILKPNGEAIDFMGYSKYNTQFKYFDPSHIMTSIDDKFGFVSVDGYTSIPFKYDEIRPRANGRFDVRIDDRWGLLTLDGRDSFGINLENPLPKQLDKNVVVQDADCECFGVLDKNGNLIIPAKYEHLYSTDDNNLFICKYNGWAGYECSSDDDPFAKWGVINSAGKEIVKVKYGFCKLDSHFILAGRDGSNYKTYPSDAVYDLYTKDGELLIGGFSEYLYDDIHELFFFFFGGEFECGGEHNVWGDFDEHESWDYYERFNRGTNLWLILDNNLKTVICDEEGKRFQFPKGFMGRVDVKKEGEKKRFVYNMPLKYFITFRDNPEHLRFCNMRDIITNNSIIINYGTQVIDIATGKKTKEFSHIEQISDKLFLYKDGNTLGITNIDSQDLIGNCFLITRPVSNYIFIAKEKSESVCCVRLYDINFIESPIATAISDITKKELVALAKNDHLKIEYNKNLTNLKSIELQASNIFDADFVNKVSIKKSRRTVPYYLRNTNYFIIRD